MNTDINPSTAQLLFDLCNRIDVQLCRRCLSQRFTHPPEAPTLRLRSLCYSCYTEGWRVWRGGIVSKTQPE